MFVSLFFNPGTVLLLTTVIATRQDSLNSSFDGQEDIGSHIVQLSDVVRGYWTALGMAVQLLSSRM
jgi:hypothetical protein